MSQVSWGDDDTARMRPAVDPWAGAHDGATRELPAQRAGRRPVYGYVYELILRGQRDGEHRYVGMCTTTIHRRVHGTSGHTSAPSIARDPWKADILPGRAGYRKLEIVYSTGDATENDRALRRAEAFWIDRLRPTENEVRPVRPPGSARRGTGRAPGAAARTKARRRPPARLVGFLLLVAVFTWLAARLVVSMHLPWPAAPWVAAPAVGTSLGWVTLRRLHRNARWLTGRRR